MRRFLSLLIVAFVLPSIVIAQDEGTVEVKSRFERSNTIYVSLGPAFTLGKNLGDYSTGLTFEAGYLKRANRILSWGPSLSYLGFAYDDTKTYPYYYDVAYDVGHELYQTGGDVNLLSLGLNLKLNFIPVSDATRFSIYGIANPFVSYISRSEVNQTIDYYFDDDEDGYYTDYWGTEEFSGDEFDALKAESKFSGGVHLGFGVELNPAKRVSVFLNVTYSYTLPISYVATESYLKDEDAYVDAGGTVYYDTEATLSDDQFPIVEKGFSAVSAKVGLAFNF